MATMLKDRHLAKGLLMVAATYALLLATPQASAISFESVLQWLKTMTSESSAWSVTTKQTALSANVQALGKQRAQQTLATAMGALTLSDRMGKALLDIDPKLGQPVSLKCEAQKEATLASESWHQIDLDRTRLMATYASTRVSDSYASANERLEVHRSDYCTVSEARSQLCTLSANGMQGWDSNYAGPFSTLTLPAEGELAGFAYASMVADIRAPAALDCKSSACAAAASDQLALAAAGSMVADALVGQVLERRVPMLTGQ